MDDQRFFRVSLLDSMEAAGFTIDRKQETACGTISFATLHPSLPVRIDFGAYPTGIQFTVKLGPVCFQRAFAYQLLMRYSSDANIVIPMVLRAIFHEVGDQFAVNYQKTFNLTK